MVQCPYCMTTIDPAATVCPNCRAVKQDRGWVAAEQVARNDRTRIVGLVIVLVLIVGIGWAGVSRYSSNKAQTQQQIECIGAVRNC